MLLSSATCFEAWDVVVREEKVAKNFQSVFRYFGNTVT